MDSHLFIRAIPVVLQSAFYIHVHTYVATNFLDGQMLFPWQPLFSGCVSSKPGVSHHLCTYVGCRCIIPSTCLLENNNVYLRLMPALTPPFLSLSPLPLSSPSFLPHLLLSFSSSLSSSLLPPFPPSTIYFSLFFSTSLLPSPSH